MNIIADPKKIAEVLTRGVVEVLPNKKGLAYLMRKRKIRLYLGIDPTGPRLHLGHTLSLWKLKEFAELGHEVILVIGTGTVLTGDPSLREIIRPWITQEEIKKNIKSLKKEVAKILNSSKLKIRYNGDWLLKLKPEQLIRIASNISAVKLFQREMFQRRIKKKNTVWTHEILYPLFQGYDSVYLKTDLEIGGTDQTFNMLIGRELEKKMINKEKFVLTLPLILGINGKPMSKTAGNCVWIEDSPQEMFGKIMSIPDQIIGDYLLLTRLSAGEMEKIKKDLKQKKINPRDLKAKLAKKIVTIYHSAGAAQRAEKEFERIFKQKKLPTKIPEIEIKEKTLNILDLLVKTKLASSKSEAKRLVLQKGVKIGGQIQTDWHTIIQIKKGQIIQVGKRKFLKVI